MLLLLLLLFFFFLFLLLERRPVVMVLVRPSPTHSRGNPTIAMFAPSDPSWWSWSAG